MATINGRAVALGFVITFLLGSLAALGLTLVGTVIAGVVGGLVAGYLADESVPNGMVHGLLAGAVGGLVVAALVAVFGSIAALFGHVPGGLATVFRGAVAIVALSLLFGLTSMVGGAVGSVLKRRGAAVEPAVESVGR